MALLFEPRIFKPFAGLRSALTLRGAAHPPYGFNMSLSVGDDELRVRANRASLAERLGFSPERLATQRQVHGATIRDVGRGYEPSESDALVCAERGWLLAVSVADCAPVLLYDPSCGVIAGVHSGWRGTALNIAGATVDRLAGLGCSRGELRAYIGAAAGQCCYEVGEDVAGRFEARFSRPIGDGKFLFDNRGVVLDQLLDAGLRSVHMELDARCTICDMNFHSFRRDGEHSGRMFAVIGMCEHGSASG